MRGLYNLVIVLLLLIVGYMMTMTISELPTYGVASAPANNYVTERYLEKGVEDTGGHNLVSNIVVAYRGYDTLFEITVLFSAVIAIFLTLKSGAPVSHAHHDSQQGHSSQAIAIHK
ncbi:MAG: hypothetical protein NUK65_12145, partial [Firmicutes bacterium]|nr:hypothetical protein [Bacillota bacterium]